MKPTLINIQKRFLQLGIGDLPGRVINRPMQVSGPAGEIGYRATLENSMKYIYRQMWVDPELRACVLDIRHMDREDTRVKKVHSRMARTAVKGGLVIDTASTNKRIIRQWKQFCKRLKLNKHEKLESDARGMAIEGNLAVQWVLDNNRVTECVRLPSETIVPNVGTDGRFVDLNKAYSQHDLLQGKVIADFPAWKLSIVRLTPDNYDDKGSLGRPYLDAARGPWRKLVMSEEDLVIRRRVRAPLRMSHVLDGATSEELKEYQQGIEDKAGDISTDYYSNKKGGVNPIQGDANLDQIADIGILLNAFFAGAPAPKGLFGYVDDIPRDVLEDLKKDYFDEIDALQDIQASAYAEGFALDLLLQGINPDSYDYEIKFKERRTETPNQAADRALKYQAVNASMETVLKTAGLDPAKEKNQLEDEGREFNPYPDPDKLTGSRPNVSITPGNARKGESATSISN